MSPVLVNPYRFGAGVSAFVAAAAALNPSAWYRLGETVGATTFVDSSGNGHDGVVTTGVTFGTTGLVTGDSDTAATVSGASTAQVVYGTWMDAAAALSVFVIGKTSTGTGFMQLVSRDQQPTREWQFRMNAGKLEFVKIAGGVVTASTVATYADGAIHDFGATWDGSNIRLYADGVKVKTQAASGAMNTANPRLYVGLRTTAGAISDGFTGVLDEAMYKAGTAWSDADFAALHAAR